VRSDPNVLVGALDGGPNQNDNFVDWRDKYQYIEPTTYNNRPTVGVLTKIQGGKGYNQLLPSITGLKDAISLILVMLILAF